MVQKKVSHPRTDSNILQFPTAATNRVREQRSQREATEMPPAVVVPFKSKALEIAEGILQGRITDTDFLDSFIRGYSSGLGIYGQTTLHLLRTILNRRDSAAAAVEQHILETYSERR